LRRVVTRAGGFRLINEFILEPPNQLAEIIAVAPTNAVRELLQTNDALPESQATFALPNVTALRLPVSPLKQIPFAFARAFLKMRAA
jgi:hypothetical protein